MLRKLIYILLWLVLLSPLWSWLVWFLSPAQPRRVVVVDKTVLNPSAREHAAFFWILKHLKWTRPDGKFYDPAVDYLGFFPGENFLYEVHDLDSLSVAARDSLAEQTDLAYFTDTYGIYTLEWYRGTEVTERSSLIYGGLSQVDVQFLQHLYRQGKPIVAEFNFLASPTPASVRAAAEALFQFHWSGWTGRYFNSLDSLSNPELPRWVVRLYKKQHNGQWPFTRGGVVFVHLNETIVILEDERDKPEGPPVIETDDAFRRKVHLPAEIVYPYWFDIVEPGALYEVPAHYRIATMPRGDSLLAHYGIPGRFPAVLLSRQPEQPIFYFAGDFADNPITVNFFAKLWGIERVAGWVLASNNPMDPQNFFWRYYLPLMTHILTEKIHWPSR